MSTHMSSGSYRRRGHSNSKTRNIVSYIFSFFLSISLMLFTVVVVMRIGVFSDGGFTSMLDEEYYAYTLNFINDEAKYYTLPTGIDPSVLEDVFTNAEVHSDVDACITTSFNGVEFEPDTTSARERLTENVKKLFEADGVDTGDSGNSNDIIKAYVDDIMKIYLEAVRMPGMELIVQVYNMFHKYFIFVAAGLLVLIAVLTLVLIKLHHFPHRGLRYVAYATAGAALMSFVIPFVIYMGGAYKNIGLSPEYFYHFGVSLISRVLHLCMLSAAVLLLITFIVILIIRYMRAHLKRHHTH